MNTNQLLIEILANLKTVKDNQEKLEIIHRFMQEKIYEESEQEVIPEQYKKVVSDIANSIDSGFVCLLNTDTLEIEEIIERVFNDPDEFEMITGESVEDMEFKYHSWNNYIKIEPMESHESFDIMKLFAENLEDKKKQVALFNALNRKHPFANFKNLVENSIYRQDWFDFKHAQLELYVWNIIENQLDE